MCVSVPTNEAKKEHKRKKGKVRWVNIEEITNEMVIHMEKKPSVANTFVIIMGT